MTPEQRAAALRLADYFTYNFWPGGLNTSGFDEAAALLRELAQEPQTPLQEAANAVMAFQWSNTREAIDALTRLVDAAYAEPQAEPSVWLVIDKAGNIMHAVDWREAAHEHINDAINEHDLTEAAEWKVVPAYAHPPQRKPLQAHPDKPHAVLIGKRWVGVDDVRAVERAHGITEAP